jgi:uncharacterized protein (DUF1330 family)
MPKAYIIFTEAIHDPDGMTEYNKAAVPSAVAHAVKALAVDRNGEVLEGTWHGDQTVLLEFESIDQARQWYESEGYQAAKKLREAAATSNVVLLTGL